MNMKYSADRFSAILMFLSFSPILVVPFPDLNESSSGIDCHPSSPSWERIINDLEIIKESRKGVQVDYSYNETTWDFNSDDKNLTGSAPGCPKSLDGTPWLHYGDPPRCYFPGYRGPCNYEDVFVVPPPTSNSPHVGSCICEWAFNDDLLKNMTKSVDGKYGFHPEKHWMVYSFETRKCYDLEKKGPCETGYVLIKSSKSESVRCVPAFKGRCTYNVEAATCEKEIEEEDEEE